MISAMLKDIVLGVAMITAWLPFISFGGIMIFARDRGRLAAGLSIGAVSFSFIGAVSLILAGREMAYPLQYAGKWFISGEIFVPFGVLLDPTSLFMLTLVAAISFLVQVYSLGYMVGDPGFSRYYGFQSLFAWAMMTLVISSSMLQLYVFWELVGLSSYLLIGFWYERFSATQAGKKAFVMTRLGDVAFFIGVLGVLIHLGDVSILQMNSGDVMARMSPALITLSALLIFGGIVGKSAQFPLLTWLPDAMEGPTPVSALLHSATMVAAGVYLFARLFPFFALSSTAMDVFLAVGATSMLLASTMAMVERDIKRIWAYSTISQLGFMIMGLAAGGYFAGVFHLGTHAAFKALLFLCSGVWIHLYGTNDVFQLGRLGARRLKVPTICIIIAGAALAGLPPLSGFFSKESIMAALAALGSPLWLMAGMAGAFLTAYYAFRPIFVLLFPWGRGERPEEEGESIQPRGAHYWVMAWPLILLSSVTLVLGFFHSTLRDFLMGPDGSVGGHGEAPGWLLPATIGVGMLGLGVAWFEFGRRGAHQVGFAERVSLLKRLFAGRWYLDFLYGGFVKYVIDGFLSTLSTRNDQKVVDGGIEGLCWFTLKSGRILSLLQSGLLRHNLILMFAVLAVLAFAFFLA